MRRCGFLLGHPRDLAVPRGAVADLALERDRLHRALEQLDHMPQARAFRSLLEQLLLELRAEVDARGERVGQAGRQCRLVGRLGTGLLGESPIEMEAALDRARLGRVGLVGDELDLSRPERAAFGSAARRGSALAPRRRRSAARRGSGGRSRRRRRGVPISRVPSLSAWSKAELALVLDALADQLAVARLEDVQRELFGRKQDDAEREEPELRHAPSLRGRWGWACAAGR